MAKEFKHLNITPEMAEVLKSLLQTMNNSGNKEVYEDQTVEDSVENTVVDETTEDKQVDPFPDSKQEEATSIEIKKPDNMGCLCCYCCHFHTRKAQHSID